MISLDENERCIDPEFLEEDRKSRLNLRRWFKKKYEFSITDPRFYNATDRDIMEEYLETLLENFRESTPDDSALALMQGRATDPDFDKKLNESFKKELENALSSAEIVEI